MTTDDPKKALEVHEANLFVTRRAKEIHQKLLKDIDHISEKQQLLIFSRVINVVFQMHYHLCFRAADSEAERLEKL